MRFQYVSNCCTCDTCKLVVRAVESFIRFVAPSCEMDILVLGVVAALRVFQIYVPLIIIS
jgi:hypothetical protein